MLVGEAQAQMAHQTLQHLDHEEEGEAHQAGLVQNLASQRAADDQD